MCKSLPWLLPCDILFRTALYWAFHWYSLKIIRFPKVYSSQLGPYCIPNAFCLIIFFLLPLSWCSPDGVYIASHMIWFSGGMKNNLTGVSPRKLIFNLIEKNDSSGNIQRADKSRRLKIEDKTLDEIKMWGWWLEERDLAALPCN